MTQSVKDIAKQLSCADRTAFELLAHDLASDTRKGVVQAIVRTRRRLDAQEAEEQRLQALYDFEQALAQQHGVSCFVGLDEVGRGPLAGPLAVGAVVLDPCVKIAGINDSKKLSSTKREAIAKVIRREARAWAVCYVEPHEIDARGMSASLKSAFSHAIAEIEAQGIQPELVLLDGNPLHFDERELNIVGGDAKCASIAAASIVAKVERDQLMCRYAQMYPQYHFEECKGYASPAHIEAIRRWGLSPIHRVSFCHSFVQERLF